MDSDKLIKAELVATKLMSDPYDEREGVWFSNADLKRLASLPPGTKLYTHIVEQGSTNVG